MKIDTIILTGGRSSRMGQDKSLLQRDHRDLFFYILDQISTLDIDDILVSRNPAQISYLTPYPVICDIYPQMGPLGGIHACMQQSGANGFLIVPVDMPLIESKDLAYLMNYGSSQQRITYYENCFLPIYLPNTPAIRQYLQQVMEGRIQQRSVKHMCKTFDSQALPILDKERLYNANTWHEWLEVKNRIAEI